MFCDITNIKFIYESCKSQKCMYHLSLLIPFIIFVEDRMRLCKVNANKQKFLCLACVLAFHYLCK